MKLYSNFREKAEINFQKPIKNIILQLFLYERKIDVFLDLKLF